MLLLVVVVVATGVDDDTGELFAATGANSDCRADTVCRAVSGATRGFCLQTISSCRSWSRFADSFCSQAIAAAAAAANINDDDTWLYSSQYRMMEINTI